MHTHKQMETGRKCFFLMMLVLYIVVVHQGNIFHQQQMARATRFWAGGKLGRFGPHLYRWVSDVSVSKLCSHWDNAVDLSEPI